MEDGRAASPDMLGGGVGKLSPSKAGEVELGVKEKGPSSTLQNILPALLLPLKENLATSFTAKKDGGRERGRDREKMGKAKRKT